MPRCRWCGSGSTQTAAETTGRQARLVALDPKYVDVIVKGWQYLAGGAATLKGDGQTFAVLEAERPLSAA